MREEGGQRAVRGGVFGEHLELLWLQVGFAADPLAQDRDTVTSFQLQLAQLAPLHDQFLPLCFLPHTHAAQSLVNVAVNKKWL